MHTETRTANDDPRFATIRLTKSYWCYSFNRVFELLQIEGKRMNHTELEHIRAEKALQQPQNHKQRSRHDRPTVQFRSTHPNNFWSIDFVYDKVLLCACGFTLPLS
ncbi:hypothetical protein [uncultured Tateyamaria sp.]|uniref:hypothetical protein n=1 Tax=uncultured Tateyamaria sp. TaxID=455651 RepID=UPI002605DE3E|nr:hypothetical protein [uncultured Tateyamaria sp.]